VYTGKITIKETDQSDLPNIMQLWNNGQVMFYVGFPRGLGVTMERLQQWLDGINQDVFSRHYSIYAQDIGYCGETFYDVDREHDLARLDIKLLPKAQGKGIAAYAFSHVINRTTRRHGNSMKGSGSSASHGRRFSQRAQRTWRSLQTRLGAPTRRSQHSPHRARYVALIHTST
jgi:GNAT superfamily N-acetyltransferase